MIDDRNLFRPVGGRADVVEMAAHLDVESARYADLAGDVEAQIAVRLARVGILIDALEDRRLVLAIQAQALTSSFADVLDFETRQNAALSYIAAIDAFMVKAVQLEARVKVQSLPLNERLALATRLENAAANVLRSAEGTSPLGDLSADMAEAARGIVAATADLAGDGLSTAKIVAIAAAIVALAYLVKG